MNGLRKEYGEFVAVDQLSFNVEKGEIFGIVGPNGAGKTTTLKMLSGLVHPTAGSIRINGIDISVDPVRVKSTLGFLPEESPLYEGMYVEDYLLFFGELYDVDKHVARKRIHSLLTDLSLNAAGKRIGDLSKGMRRKVAIARSLINDPQLLIYDEPGSGLDPMTSRFITEYIRALKKSGKTIIFSAHNLYQMEKLCDRILIIKDGRQVTLGSASQIRKEHSRVLYRLEFMIEDIADLYVEGVKRLEDRFVLVTADISVVNDITGRVATNGGRIIEMRTIEPALEEVFLELMGVDLSRNDG
ncbi:ATP-binding cassette domain-containing protein [uncultured Methanomethylovorans sp.]|uniref:ABC transporter ATP-binding protein n=1 Tax=uncultured Methanomethylovorans sp. TaxID=183759 RepID=UPI003749F50E